MKDVPIPDRLAKNDRDRRGFPIPFIVYRDKTGTPHFTVDDVEKIDLALSENLCGLCGEPLLPGQMWLISGPESSFFEQGLYTNPPAHEECARYAMQVCPFLAASKYTKLIEDKTLDPQAVHDGALLHNDHIAPPQPIFLTLARTSGLTLIDAQDGSGKKYILPHRPWEELEFWKNGARIGQAEAEKFVAASALVPGELTWWPLPGRDDEA